MIDRLLLHILEWVECNYRNNLL